METPSAAGQPSLWSRAGAPIRRLLDAGETRARKRLWWSFLALGLLLLAVSSAVLGTLGKQLALMHAPGQPGFSVQGFSLSHLENAFDTWRDYTSTANALSLATPRGIAVTWALVDLFVFIPGYALAGGILLLRGSATRKGAGLGPALRFAAALLVGVVLFDVIENTLTLVALAEWGDGPAWAYSAAVAVANIVKSAAGAFVVLAVVLLGLDTWGRRSKEARATGTLLRGQIAVAAVTIVFFNLPIQLPDVFLDLGATEAVALCIAATLLSLATWSIARWMVVRREERDDADASRVKAVLVAVAAALVVLAVVNVAGDGSAWGPLIPLVIVAAVFLLSLVLRQHGKRDEVRDLGRPGVFVPQVLAAIGVTAATTAGISAASLLAVASRNLWLAPLVMILGALAVALLAGVVFLIELRVSGERDTRLRDWRDAPDTTKSALQAPGTRTVRTPRVGWWVFGTSVATVVAVAVLLSLRISGPQFAGAAASVLLFFCALTLVLGLGVAGTDAWDQLVGVPPALSLAGFSRTPFFVLLLLWGTFAAMTDDGSHWDVRKLPQAPGAEAVSLSDAFADWKGDATSGASDRRAVPLVFVATSGGGIRAAYWTALSLDCVFDSRAAETWTGADPCATTPSLDAGDVFLASGISGGSLGLVEWDASRDPQLGDDWVDDRLGRDFVAPTVAWGLLVEVPRSFLHFPAIDRAAVLEDSWEGPWGAGDNPMRRGFLEAQRATYDGAWEAPLLMLNGSSVLDGCVVNVSLLDEGRTGAKDVPLTDCTAGDESTLTEEPQGDLPMTADVVDYLDCGEDRDVRRSTAALLSARFPYVSSAGRLPACRADESTKYVVDGGYLDTSAADPPIAAYLAIEDLIEDHNATSTTSCVVPYFLQLDNGYLDPVSPPKSASPPNQLLAPVQALWASTGLQSRAERARGLAAELFTRPFETVPGDDGSAVTTSRYARIVPKAHPGVEAPLGWVLSEDSRRDLEKQLYAGNAGTIADVKAWATDVTCAPLPE